MPVVTRLQSQFASIQDLSPSFRATWVTIEARYGSIDGLGQPEGSTVNIEVIEFEMICRVHGSHKTIAPVQLPRPRYCVHCFLPVVERRELRRVLMELPLPNNVGSEAWIG